MTADHTPERLTREGLGRLLDRLLIEHWPNSGVNPWYLADLIREHDAAHLADVEARLAAAGGVLRRWDDVLAECKQADPRWILDQGVMALETARNELRAALHPASTEEPRDE